MKKIAVFMLFLCSSIFLFSQEEIITDSDTLRKDALNVYYPNASSHLKQEISFINYVRDRKVADLVIISSSQSTGSGGQKYTYFLEGQGKYKGMIDTIEFSSNPDDTFEMIRAKRVKTFKMGLMRYIQKTPLSEYIDIHFTQAMSDEVSTDRWNSWVFNMGIHGFAFASESSDYYSLSASTSASRITEDWKLEFDGSYNTNLREIRWTDQDTGEEFTESDPKKSSDLNILIVKSLGEHWSAGFTSELSSSIYHNYLAHFEFKPGLEYNVYPFSQSTRQQLRLLYSIGPVYNNYCDTTQYFKKNEIIGQHGLMIAFMNIQKWGDFNVSASWENYLHDWNLNRISFNGSVSLKVAKGLRLSMSGGYSFIHDQINLRKGGASTSDVLLSRKEMATSYSYDVFFSISYTFGSIYNNVVNPRFNQRGGSTIIMF